MSIEKLNPSGVLPKSTEQQEVDKAEVVRLAQQFEAMLMTQMLREMRKSMLAEEEEDSLGLGSSAMTDTGDIELGIALSKIGGLGLGQSLLSAFERQINTLQGVTPDSAAAPNATPGLENLIPATVPPAVNTPFLPAEVTAPAPISSQFGWRQDPISGTPQFHKGVDIAVAYGRDVRAAADGVVAFAGTQNGYGNTVVVNHAGGRQTRYAHLSEQAVQAGDRVTEGQVLGKSGNSGRSTGPHLHFELLVDGRPVDPGAALAE